MRLLQPKTWIDEFIERTSHLPSPELFRRWAGIACVAGALERKVWVRVMRMDLYPNMYTVLVGPPGVGKSVVLSLTELLWRSITQLHVAPKSMSKASLMDALDDAKRTKMVIQERAINLTFNALLVNAGELGVFLPQYDPEFMNSLTDIWDGQLYEERRRSKDIHLKIDRPQLNIVAGTTPPTSTRPSPRELGTRGSSPEPCSSSPDRPLSSTYSRTRAPITTQRSTALSDRTSAPSSTSAGSFNSPPRPGMQCALGTSLEESPSQPIPSSSITTPAGAPTF